MALSRDDYLATLGMFRGSAAALVRDGFEHVLIVRPTYKDTWELPGGAIAPGESPHDAVRREVQEELGANLHIGSLLVVDFTPERPENPSAMLHFVFDAATPTDSQIEDIVLPPDELSEFTFAELEVAERLCGPRVGPRLTAAVTALRNDRALYLERGRLLDAP